jgi:hypothetical protein
MVDNNLPHVLISSNYNRMSKITPKPVSAEKVTTTESYTSKPQTVHTPTKIAPTSQKIVAQRMNNPRPKLQQRAPRGR